MNRKIPSVGEVWIFSETTPVLLLYNSIKIHLVEETVGSH